MIELRYLQAGLHGLANAHRANTMAGHLGAAAIAGRFFSEDLADLDPDTVAAIQRDLDRLIEGVETVWFDSAKTGVTIPELFEPLPAEDPDEDAIPNIAVTLGKDIAHLRQSGHDVIFAATALRALHDHPDLATPAAVRGIRQLLAGFHGKAPGRGYYGKETGWLSGENVTLDPADDFPPYEDEDEMAELLVDELIQFAGVRKQGFGGLFHLINHAAALTELARFGYRGLARQGLAAHHRHLRLWRSLPDVEAELGALVRAKHDPRDPAYWKEQTSGQWSGHLTHRIKTLYGFHTLLRAVDDDAKRAKAGEAFLYLMG